MSDQKYLLALLYILATVGLYVDGVYVALSVGALLHLVGIERIEVLRAYEGIFDRGQQRMLTLKKEFLSEGSGRFNGK